MKTQYVFSVFKDGLRSDTMCGSHPGTIVLVMLILLGLVAGGWLGALVFAAVCIPPFAWGVWERGKLVQHHEAKEVSK